MLIEIMSIIADKALDLRASSRIHAGGLSSDPGNVCLPEVSPLLGPMPPLSHWAIK